MTLPVKPINEIEVKSEVSDNDKILILDSVSEEYKQGLNLFSENEAGKMALDVRNFISEIKGMTK